jgi:2-polyprenyl-3-methyl-5-hydroxy-6-metoxy-1,4-benzoquinol methylase
VANTVICIHGMGRSGTSMVAHLLKDLGLDLGPEADLSAARRDNIEGFFENIHFNRINEALLARLGGAWNYPPRMAAGWELEPGLQDLRAEAAELCGSFPQDRAWGWKDPRNSLLLPFWKPFLPGLRHVICLRNPLEVARSLWEQYAIPLDDGARLWGAYTEAALRHSLGQERIFVLHDEAIADPGSLAERLAAFCGLGRPAAGATGVVKAALQHQTVTQSGLLQAQEVPLEMKAAYWSLRTLLKEEDPGAALAALFQPTNGEQRSNLQRDQWQRTALELEGQLQRTQEEPRGPRQAPPEPPSAGTAMVFSGERYVPELSGDIESDHWHRYLLVQDLAAGKEILDIASGEGYGSAFLAKTARRVTGVDIDAAAVAHATARYQRGNLSFLQGSCSAIPMAQASVDLVVCFETLEHHDQHEAMMAEIRRVLRPGGLLVISSPDKLNYSIATGQQNPFHVKELYQGEFEQLLGAHFSHRAFYGQSLVQGSAVMAEVSGGPVRNFRLYDGVPSAQAGLAKPRFWIAVASDAPLPALASGVLEADPDPRLAMFNYLENEYKAATAELAALRATRIHQVGRAWWSLKRGLKKSPALLRKGLRLLASNPGGFLQKLKLARASFALVRRSRRGRGASAALGIQPFRQAWELLARCQPLLRPLQLQLSSAAPKRVNVLVSTLDFDYFFAGYMGMFQFARSLAEAGYQVRLMAVDSPGVDLMKAERELARYGLEGFLGQVQLLALGDRSKALVLSPEDRFVATSAWTAHIAHAACQGLSEKRFYFLTQEYECLFFPSGTYYAYAHQSYSLPQVRSFSTALLRDFYAREGIGHDAEGPGSRPAAASFENAVPPLHPSRSAMIARKKKRLLFYSRVEAHTSRNMFELGMQALSTAISQGVLDPKDWEFFGIGSLLELPDLPLPRGCSLKLIRKTSLDEYYKMLPDFDLGLSLMLSPHPSLPPLDMAAAGMLVLTNVFMDKSAARMAEISPNILAVEPDCQALVEGLRTTAGRITDVEARLAGSQLRWARSWAETFHPAFMEQIREFMGPLS